MILQYPSDLAQVSAAEPFVPAQLDGCQPRLGLASRLVHMHMRGFIRLGAVEANAVTLFAQNCRHGRTVTERRTQERGSGL
jgi:hypothetical protein